MEPAKNTLIQKHIGFVNAYRIEKDRVVLSRKSFVKKEEFSIQFDNLGFDINRRKTFHIWWVIPLNLALACGFIFAAIEIFHTGERGTFIHIIGALLCAGIGIYCFFEKDEDKIYVAGGHNHLDLDVAKPDQETVESFISELHRAMRTYFKGKYVEVNPVLNRNYQYHNFKWLLEIQAID